MRHVWRSRPIPAPNYPTWSEVQIKCRGCGQLASYADNWIESDPPPGMSHDDSGGIAPPMSTKTEHLWKCPNLDCRMYMPQSFAERLAEDAEETKLMTMSELENRIYQAVVETFADPQASSKLAVALARVTTEHFTKGAPSSPKAAELAEVNRPIVEYYEAKQAWDGGCAQPSEPRKGQVIDFIEINRRLIDAVTSS